MTPTTNPPTETREQIYRLAYCDGFMAALVLAYPDEPIPDDLLDHWRRTLLNWKNRANHAPVDTAELPPTFGAEPSTP